MISELPKGITAPRQSANRPAKVTRKAVGMFQSKHAATGCNFEGGGIEMESGTDSSIRRNAGASFERRTPAHLHHLASQKWCNSRSSDRPAFSSFLAACAAEPPVVNNPSDCLGGDHLTAGGVIL